MSLGLVTAVSALAGCVGTVDSPSPTDPHPVITTLPGGTGDGVSVDTAIAIAEYRSCLAANGVVIADIPVDSLGRPRMALAFAGFDLSSRLVLDALETCAPEASSGLLDLGSDPELAAMVRSGLTDLVECLRDNGVPDYPDPVPSFDGVGAPFPVARIPWGDPDLSGAFAVCGERLMSPSS